MKQPEFTETISNPNKRLKRHLKYKFKKVLLETKL